MTLLILALVWVICLWGVLRWMRNNCLGCDWAEEQRVRSVAGRQVKVDVSEAVRRG